MKFFFVFLLFNALMCWLLAKRVKEAFPGNRRILISLIAGYIILLSPTLIYPFNPKAFREMRGEGGMYLLFPAYILLFSMLGYFLWVAVVDLPVAVSRAFKKLAKVPTREVDESRRRFMAKAALAPPLAALAASSVGAALAYVEPVITKVDLPVRPEHTGLKGLKIAQFSDVHVGRFTTAERLTEIANSVNAQKPDIVVCTGDLFDNDYNSQVEQVTNFLMQMRAPLGQYFCFGNHEYYAAGSTQVEDMIAAIESAGFKVLRDEHKKIETNDGHMYLLGVDYPGRVQPHVSFKRALEGIPDDGAPRVALAHSPVSWGAGRDFPIDLTLSGHTHGGQVSAGRIGDLELSPALAMHTYVRGDYEHNGKRLHVNCGTGSWMPVRLNVPPEITVVEFS
ncbi:MAG: metallophosphoesterase [Planctomycetes bacterium]|nr:metallophosphoesterase [Planctomycetota bacterium]